MINKANTVSDFMNKEHEYLDQLWAKFFDKNSLEIDETFFADFKKRELEHIRFEDEFLFPALNEYLGIAQDEGLASLARRDHGGIVKLLEMMERAMQIGELDALEMSARNLDNILQAHRKREQEIHYPVSDNFVSQDEWENIIEKFNLVK